MARRHLAPPAPKSSAAIAASMGYHGAIRVLFETPSGFAVFTFDGVRLMRPGALEDIWANFGSRWRARCILLKDFQFFGDKSAAINSDTGVSDKLRKMLEKWCSPGQKLAVGKPEYKEIIEARLGIPCLHDDAVMELMWGIKNLMHSLVPKEKSRLAKEDCLQMSQGLKTVLNRYGFDVKPEMVSDPIIVVACTLYDCDICDKKVSGPLCEAGNIIKDVSHINCEDWDIKKLATAVKMLSFPGEKIVGCDPEKMFSKDELSKLVNDAPKYKDKLVGYDCLRAYNIVVSSDKVRTEKHKLLRILVKEAEEVYQAGQEDCLRGWGLEQPSQDRRICEEDQPSKRFRSQNLTGAVI